MQHKASLLSGALLNQPLLWTVHSEEGETVKEGVSKLQSKFMRVESKCRNPFFYCNQLPESAPYLQYSRLQAF